MRIIFLTCAGGGEDLADRSHDLSQQQQQPVEKVIGCWDDQMCQKDKRQRQSQRQRQKTVETVLLRMMNYIMTIQLSLHPLRLNVRSIFLQQEF